MRVDRVSCSKRETASSRARTVRNRSVATGTTGTCSAHRSLLTPGRAEENASNACRPYAHGREARNRERRRSAQWRGNERNALQMRGNFG